MRVSGGDDEEKYSAAKSNLMKAMERKADVDGLDSVFGFDAIESGERIGWLFNVCSVSLDRLAHVRTGPLLSSLCQKAFVCD